MADHTLSFGSVAQKSNSLCIDRVTSHSVKGEAEPR